MNLQRNDAHQVASGTTSHASDVTAPRRTKITLHKDLAVKASAGRTRVLLVASGKGGVGKSTISVNIAVALAALGYAVALLDADIYGASLPRMLGTIQKPLSFGDKLVPLERYGVRMMSLGVFQDEDTPIAVRGPIVHHTVLHLLQQVEWGTPDYLVVDLPPGTGDVALTVAGVAPGSAMLIVTTPQQVAAKVAVRAAKMASIGELRPVGVVENMSYFICPHGEALEIFGRGGGADLARQLGVQLLGRIPLEAAVRAAGDAGAPIVLDQSSVAGRILRALAKDFTRLEPPPTRTAPRRSASTETPSTSSTSPAPTPVDTP